MHLSRLALHWLLPSDWKVRLENFLWAIFCCVAVLPLWFGSAWLLSSVVPDLIALSSIPLLAAVLLTTTGLVALHPQASWASIGIRRSWAPSLAGGLALGAAACGVLAAAAVVAGGAAWTPLDPSTVRFDWRSAPLPGLLVLAVGSVGEELYMRGLPLQFLAGAFGRVAAVAATSAVFALLHGANPNVTDLATLNTALYGAVFGIAVLHHRSLWLAIGLHFSWNVTQSALGANLSGITIRLTSLNLELRGADWLAGGEYGLEGGVLGTGVAALLAAALWWLPRGRGGGRLLWETAGRAARSVGPAPGDSVLGLSPAPAGRDGEEREDHPRAAR